VRDGKKILYYRKRKEEVGWPQGKNQPSPETSGEKRGGGCLTKQTKAIRDFQLGGDFSRYRRKKKMSVKKKEKNPAEEGE